LHVKKATLPNARLGKKDTNLRAVLAKGPPDNVLPGIDGCLGTASLKARRIDFNYATNTIAWK